MKEHKSEFPVEKMCGVFGVSRSRFNGWLLRPVGTRETARKSLLEDIKRVHAESKGRYGSPRITSQLRDEGKKASRPLVARIMRKESIQSIVRKRFRITTTDSAHAYPTCDNHLDRCFSADRLGEKWVSDITYIRTDTNWLYLTTVLDLADRKVIGWALSETLKASKTSVAALKMAITNRPPTEKLIFHSDRGVQYACHEFSTQLK